jgi:hypothetical protein
MVLNSELFARVAKLAGYQKSQYRGSDGETVRFLVYDGDPNNPSRAQVVHVTNDQECQIIRQEPHTVLQSIDYGPVHNYTYPQ